MGWCQVVLLPDGHLVLVNWPFSLCAGQSTWRTGFDDVVSIFRADEASIPYHSQVIVASWRPSVWQARDTSHFHSHLKSILPLYHHYYLSPSPAAYSRRTRRSRSLIDYISPSASGTSLGLQEVYDTLVEGLSSNKVRDLGREMGRWRVLKSAHEQAVMRKAADLSGHAHTKVIL